MKINSGTALIFFMIFSVYGRDIDYNISDEIVYEKIGHDKKTLRWSFMPFLSAGQSYYPLRFYKDKTFEEKPKYTLKYGGIFNEEENVVCMQGSSGSLYFYDDNGDVNECYKRLPFIDYHLGVLYVAIDDIEDEIPIVKHKGEKYFLNLKHLKDYKIFQSAKEYKRKKEKAFRKVQANKKRFIKKVLKENPEVNKSIKSLKACLSKKKGAGECESKFISASNRKGFDRCLWYMSCIKRGGCHYKNDEDKLRQCCEKSGESQDVWEEVRTKIISCIETPYKIDRAEINSNQKIIISNYCELEDLPINIYISQKINNDSYKRDLGVKIIPPSKLSFSVSCPEYFNRSIYYDLGY